MIDLQANVRIIQELERMTDRARRGELISVVVVGIDKSGQGDGAFEYHRDQPILVAATLGAMKIFEDKVCGAEEAPPAIKRAG